MSVETDDYSSILMFAGTNTGRIFTSKLLPKPGGGFAVQAAGSVALEDPVVSISPLDVDTGHAAYASQAAVGGLRGGLKVNGSLLVVTQGGAHIFRPAAGRGPHKAWEEVLCDSAAVVESEGRGIVLVGLFGDGLARAYSIPALRELGRTTIGDALDVTRAPEAIITSSGDILGWKGPSELSVLNVWGTGQSL